MIIDVPSDDPQVVAKEVWINAAPATVYGFFTDEQKLLQWIGVAATVEPYAGGIFRFEGGGGNNMSGKFVELVPHTRIVFTWGWEGGLILPPGSSTVEITFAPENGGTRLSLIHRGLKPEVKDKHGFGWVHYLTRLTARSQGQDPGIDTFAKPDSGKTA